MIQMTGISKQFGETHVLSDIKLTINGGEVFGLLGPNGAGKTTLMKIIIGQVAASGGQLTVPPGFIGFCPQTIALYPSLTVQDNINFFLRLYDLSAQYGDEALERVGMQNHRHDKVDHLSGGMKRRINLAVSILKAPKILILDEPTVGVDSKSRQEIIEIINNLKTPDNIIIFISHYLDEVEKICDRLAIIHKGKVLAIGTNEDLLRNHSKNTVVSWKEDGNCHRLKLPNEAVSAKIAMVLAQTPGAYDWEVRRERLEDVYLRLVDDEH